MTQAVDEQVWFEKDEAAAYLRMSTVSIDRYVKRGLLKVHKLPGHATAAPVRFKRTDLDAFVEGRA